MEWNSGMEYWNGGMLQRAYIPYQDHPAHYSALVSRFSGFMEWEYTGI